jgi:hypothetical protein
MAKKEGEQKKEPQQHSELEKTLIANFVSLQKVMVNLSLKFDELSGNISKLLELFEISAKALAEKEIVQPNTSADEETSKDIKKIADKLNNLLDQNKVIARGLTLMYDRIPNQQSFPTQNPAPRPLPKMNPPQDNDKPISFGDYQKSISE